MVTILSSMPKKWQKNDVTSTQIKQSYFAENYDLNNSDRQAINALVHAGM
jgi:hypothetical protein